MVSTALGIYLVFLQLYSPDFAFSNVHGKYLLALRLSEGPVSEFSVLTSVSAGSGCHEIKWSLLALTTRLINCVWWRARRPVSGSPCRWPTTELWCTWAEFEEIMVLSAPTTCRTETPTASLLTYHSLDFLRQARHLIIQFSLCMCSRHNPLSFQIEGRKVQWLLPIISFCRGVTLWWWRV